MLEVISKCPLSLTSGLSVLFDSSWPLWLLQTALFRSSRPARRLPRILTLNLVSPSVFCSFSQAQRTPVPASSHPGSDPGTSSSLQRCRFEPEVLTLSFILELLFIYLFFRIYDPNALVFLLKKVTLNMDVFFFFFFFKFQMAKQIPTIWLLWGGTKNFCISMENMHCLQGTLSSYQILALFIVFELFCHAF